MVLDTSVVASWYLPSQATLPATELLNEIHRYEVIAPVIFEIEIRNVMLLAERRRAQSPDDSDTKLGNIFALVEVRHEPLRQAARRAMPLARTAGLKLYDAIYLDLALSENRSLATRDGPLVMAARRMGVDVLDLRD